MRLTARSLPNRMSSSARHELVPDSQLPLCVLPACACSGVIALVGTLGYILSFAIGAGPVTGLIVPEINKEAVRGEGRAGGECVCMKGQVLAYGRG